MGTFTGRHENETTVRKVSAGFVTGDNGWTFAPPGEHLGRFKPGLTYTLETRNLSVVTGCRIDGEWLWRRSDEWLDDDHRVTVARHNAERAERLRDNRETWEAREAALPAWLRSRIEHFRSVAGERFELDGWAYELATAELAVLYDEVGLGESDAVTAYGDEHGTSINQHDVARLLAAARRNDPEWSAAGSVSAMFPDHRGTVLRAGEVVSRDYSSVDVDIVASVRDGYDLVPRRPGVPRGRPVGYRERGRVVKPCVKWHPLWHPLAWVVGCMCEPHPPGVPVVLSVHSTWERAMRAANEHYDARHRGES